MTEMSDEQFALANATRKDEVTQDAVHVAAKDLRDRQFRAVTQCPESGGVKVCDPLDTFLGILQNCPAVGEPAVVRTRGTSIMRVTGDVLNYADICVSAEAGMLKQWRRGDFQPWVGDVYGYRPVRGAGYVVGSVKGELQDKCAALDATFIAEGDLTQAQFCAVTLGEHALTVRVCGPDDVPGGILQNRPAAGEAATVRIAGQSTARVRWAIRGTHLGVGRDAGMLKSIDDDMDEWDYSRMCVGIALENVEDTGIAVSSAILVMRNIFAREAGLHDATLTDAPHSRIACSRRSSDLAFRRTAPTGGRPCRCPGHRPAGGLRRGAWRQAEGDAGV